MSISNDIKNLLDIQDKHITFEENCVTKGEHKGVQCKFIDATLTYETTHCTKCGIVNNNNIVIKNGRQISRITLPTVGLHPVYLRLKKQRFLCRACGCSFTAKTSLVKTHCFIFNQTENENRSSISRS